MRGLAALVILATLAACTGTPTPSTANPSPTVAAKPSPTMATLLDIGTVTLTATDCTWDALVDPLNPPPTALLRFSYANATTTNIVLFVLFKVRPGNSFTDLEDNIAEVSRNPAAPHTPPSAATVVVDHQTPAGTNGTLIAPVTAGTYGVGCERADPTTMVTLGYYLIGPFVFG